MCKEKYLKKKIQYEVLVLRMFNKLSYELPNSLFKIQLYDFLLIRVQNCSIENVKAFSF